MENGRVRRARPDRAAERFDRFPLGRRRTRRRRQVEPRGQGGARRRRRETQALCTRRGGASARGGRSRVPVFRRRRYAALSQQQAERRDQSCPGAGRKAATGRRIDGADRHRVRPAGGAIRHRPWPRQRGQGLQRRRPLHAGLAAEDHRRAAGPGHHRCAAVRRQRRQDTRQVDDHHRRRDEPLVSLRHELPRRDQPADAVRLCRPERRRLGALRRPGEAAPADRLDRACIRARLDPSAAATELDLLLLRAHRPVALRKAGRRGSAVPAGGQGRVRRKPDRLQRARRAHGLAAERAAAEDQPAESREGRAGCGTRPEGLRRQGAEGWQPADELRGPGRAAELAAQPVRLAQQPARFERQGPRVFLQAPAGYGKRRAGQGPRQGRSQAEGSQVARAGSRRKARSPRDDRLPDEHDLPVQRRRAADRQLVREERSQYQRHAPVHPPAFCCSGSGVAVAQRLGDLQGLREGLQRGLRRPPRRREGSGSDAADARHARPNWHSPSR